MKFKKSNLGCLITIIILTLLVWGLYHIGERKNKRINWEISPLGLSKDSLNKYCNKKVPYY